jgi:hypothetical protein
MNGNAMSVALMNSDIDGRPMGPKAKHAQLA